ncbi:MmcQ/YjbR family DNA-binding protein [Streptomyces noboritoensis]|uniref:MmcQ/YjbR family DNA-binding protein n=1 Tax=Streptomyces noboritoensis TaxID=67337 RepID=A0ABV6TCV5_9ACTN
MTPADVAALALDLPEATEHEPSPHMQLYKVGGKIFAILTPATGTRRDQVTLKCEPDLALHLRAQYPAAVQPSYYGRLRHGNTVILDGTVPAEELTEMVHHSWGCVVAALPRAARDRLRTLN